MSRELIPENVSDLRRSILETALSDRGLCEDPPGSNRGPVEKYFPRWLRQDLEIKDRDIEGVAKGPAWCAFAVCYWWNKALNEDPLGRRTGSSWKLAQLAKSEGLWLPWTDLAYPHTVQPGDIFVMLKHHEDAPRSTGHVGLVLRVDEGNHYINTVEGNSGNRVRVGRRRIGTPMRGFISPVGFGQKYNTKYELGVLEADDLGRRSTR